MHIETPETFADGGKNFDEDGRTKRTGINYYTQISSFVHWFSLKKLLYLSSIKFFTNTYPKNKIFFFVRKNYFIQNNF